MSQRDKYEESEVYVFSFHAGREDDNKVTDGRTDKCTQFPISSGSVRKEGSKPVTDSVGLLLTTLSLLITVRHGQFL